MGGSSNTQQDQDQQQGQVRKASVGENAVMNTTKSLPMRTFNKTNCCYSIDYSKFGLHFISMRWLANFLVLS